jgi:hypothetical protein
MRTISRVLGITALIGLVAGPTLFLSARSAAGAADDPRSSLRPDDVTLTDEPLPAFRQELLDLAFDTASALPLEPHRKTRSRVQEDVFAAAIELGQARRALGYAARIDGWRRGAAYADLAAYCAAHDAPVQARQCVELARPLAAVSEREGAQEWQRDEILAKVAKALTLLDESPKVEALADKAFEERLAAVDPAVQSGNLDRVRASLEMCTGLFDRFYEDADRRTRAQQKIESSWGRVPGMIRIELTIELAESALKHADASHALELVKGAHGILEEGRWLPRDLLPMAARLAKLRHRAGDSRGARTEADEALAAFDAQREEIPNVDRAGALRPLAEAYAAIGDAEAALGVYRKAVGEGIANSNSRPRVEDLAATCCSMAVADVAPDADLGARMKKIRAGLGEPW